MEYVLQTRGLTKTYKGVKAVDFVSMNIPKGAIYGFVGRNGSGKTTLIRLVTGLITATSGDFSLYGASNRKETLEARRKLAAVVETPSIYLGMTAHENLKLQCELIGADEAEIDKILQIVNLTFTGKKQAKDFSLGMKQRLGIAIALLGNPEFLILDEPTNGLDPESIIEIRQLLLRLNRERNITILVSSHILTELSKIATHYGFISKGRLIEEVSAHELEGVCRQRSRAVLDSVSNFQAILAYFPTITEYRYLSETEVEIYGQFDITDFALALRNAGIKLLRFTEVNEDLESYYIRIMGGETYA